MTTSASGSIPVSWTVDEIVVEATLTRPRGDGPFPAVALVAGSGPTDRDWNSPLIPGTNGSAALLARELTAAGFVTLRYDKRASGPHAQENIPRLVGRISMQGHEAELAGGMALLAQRPDVNAGRIFILANSEGCIHALHYQLHTAALPCAGLVLTGAPARPISAVTRSQIAAQLAGAPGGDGLLARFDALTAEFAGGRPVPIDESLPEGMHMLLLGLTAPVNQPFARELWVADPAALLAAVTVPTLIVIGKKDLQIDWQADGAVFAALAAQRPDIAIVYPEDANHVLKHEPTPREQLTGPDAASRYNAADTVLDAAALAAITGWLAAQIR
ncbi:MAG: alpha/beta hydrolase [Chloroflexales bacterium]|nr:alpha/beta hydrolase [Chloroflexales bacterium]